MTERPRVVVVGGGLAGLAAALACADGGAEVTVVEARTRLGGATFSFRRNGLVIDNGQHVFLRCCTAYRKLLARIGSTPSTTLQRRLAIPVLSPTGRLGWIRRTPGLPAPLHLAASLARYPFLSPRDRLRAAAAAVALALLGPDPGLDRRTFSDWLVEHGQREEAIKTLWDVITLPTLNVAAEQGSLALAAKVFQTGLLREAAAGDVGYSNVPLSDLHAEPAQQALTAAGASVRTRVTVRAIEAGPTPGPVAIRVDGDRIEADAVVLAVPHDAAATLLPSAALPHPEALRALGTSPIVNLHVVYDRPVTELSFAAAVGSPVQWFFDRTKPAGLEAGQYLAVSLSGAVREIEERTGTLRARFLPALEALVPRARDAVVRSFFVTREDAATFRQVPGTAALRPGPRTALPRLFLAGAWTDTGWPATMEGAVRSGVAAARHALVALGRTRRLPAEVAA